MINPTEMFLYLTLIVAFCTNVAELKRIDVLSKNESSPLKVNCKNIKCPAIKDPVCVRIKNTNEKSKNATYTIAINKCEIKYAKCRQGIDAVIVPMKKCMHVADGTKRFGEKRIKRQASDETPPVVVVLQKDDSDDVNDADDEGLKNKYDSSNENNGSDNVDSDGLHADVANPEETDDDIKNHVSDGDDNDEDGDGGDDNGDDKNNNSEVFKGQELNAEVDRLQDDNKVEPDLLGVDYEQKMQDVDNDQYEKDCPKVCPAREVMVCARCQHNVYRTFLSTCHLRIFNCQYPTEKLELINRQPCIQSAPYLNDLPEAKGVVSEPGDKDDVLKFIYCRDKGRLNKDDPRCKFN